jgi:hypothetical protein
LQEYHPECKDNNIIVSHVRWRWYRGHCRKSVSYSQYSEA